MAVETGRVQYAPDDYYNFGLTFCGTTPEWVFEKLEEMRRNSIIPNDATPGPLGAGAEYFEALNLRTGNPIYSVDDLIPYRAVDFSDAIARLNERTSWTLRFVSPLRIETNLYQAGHRYFDAEFFDMPRFLNLVYMRINQLAGNKDGNSPPDLPESAIVENSLYWLDLPTKEIRLGGSCGEVHIQGQVDQWAPWLILGQYLHVGKNTRFGFGAYRIPEVSQSIPFARSFGSLAQTAFSLPNIRYAIQEMEKNASLENEPNILIAMPEAERIAGEYLNNRRPADPLHGAFLFQNGKKRALAVPSLRDRVAQRAVLHVLGPAIDQLLEDNSFAFRKGFSRRNAAEVIREAYRHGYRWALKADIEAFFDEVDWRLLRQKLIALYADDPVVDLLMDWVERPVLWQGSLLKREKGLPQGAVVSPLLSNLFLDEFDERLQRERLKLVRYADDFLVLCKERRQAEEALAVVRQALADQHLALNEDKTKIVDFEHGFTYLGYLFCRSLVLDEKKDKAVDVPPAPSWAREERLGQLHPQGWVEESDPEKGDEEVHLLVSGGDKHLHLKQGRLIVGDGEGSESEMPWTTIRSISCLGGVRISPAVRHRCLHDGVTVTFADMRGNLLGMLSPQAIQSPETIVNQVLFAQDPARCLDIARRIVAAKIHNQNVAVRRQEGVLDEKLTILERRCDSAASLKTLLGLEGQAAAVYFRRFAGWVRPFEFSGRSRRPAKDPVNVLLNFGYSLLYKQAALALVAAGLLPTLGLYHAPRKDFYALAADLMEEFRFLVDGLALTLIHRGQISPGDFTFPEKGEYSCLLAREASKGFVRAFEERISTKVKLRGEKEKSYRDWLNEQADQLLDVVSGRLAIYEPIKVR